MDRRIALFAAIAGIIILTSGCLSSLGLTNYARDYKSTMSNYTFYDESQISACKVGKCVCLVCKNSSAWFGFTTSFVGGSCRYVTDCTANKFSELLDKTKTKSELPRQFMIGQGYSFSEFADAEPWCADRLDMAVQWLWSNNTPYPLPDPERATCFLDKGIMPVYVLYSNDTAVSSSRAREIATKLGKGGPLITALGGAGAAAAVATGGPVGPVIVTTEMDADLRDAGVRADVISQVREIDAGCGNVRGNTPDTSTLYCMVALGARMGDYDGVNQVMKDLGAEANKVDLIAFGINAHRVNLSEANDDNCNADLALMQGLRFAKFSLYNWSKPTVVPYILFDSTGKDGVGSCSWSEDSMINGYSSVFKTWLVPYQKAGVVGVAAYDFNYSQYHATDPLNCTDCNLGKNKERMQAWFASCRSYKMLAAKYPAGDNMIVFPNQPGGDTCDYSLNPMGILQMTYNSYAEAATPALTNPNVTLVRCDACVNEVYTTANPFPVKVNNPSFNLANNPALNKTYCKSVPEIEFYASKYSVDPMLLRAIAIRESNFQQCAAAKVYASGKGIDAGCYAKGYDYVPDPDEICNDANSAPPVGGKPEYRYCALGFMQVLDPPYTFWPAQYRDDNRNGPYYTGGGAQLYSEAKAAGRSDVISELEKECGRRFNPFNTTNAACAGAYRFSLNLATAKAKVQSNLDALGVSSDANKARVYSNYLALHYYRGYGTWVDTWIRQFKEQKIYTAAYCSQSEHKSEIQCNPDSPGAFGKDCYGQQDFVYYVRMCQFKMLKQPDTGDLATKESESYGDYGSAILSNYRGLVENGCDSAACPSWRRLQTQTCTNLPTAGIPTQPTDTNTDKCTLKTN